MSLTAIFPKYNPNRCIPISGTLFDDTIPYFEEKIRFYQKFQLGDTFEHQVHASNSLTPTCYYTLVDCTDTVVDSWTSDTLQMDDPGTYDMLYCRKDLLGYDDGIYFIKLRINWYDDPQTQFNEYYIFEPIHIAESHPHTVKIAYMHEDNSKDMIFVTNDENFIPVYHLRIEGGFASDGYTPSSKDSVYQNQEWDTVLIDSVAYETRKLLISGPTGIPNWLTSIINNIFSCSDVAIDGVGYCKNEGAKFEAIREKQYPYAGWSIDLIQSKASNLDAYYEIGEEVVNIGNMDINSLVQLLDLLIAYLNAHGAQPLTTVLSGLTTAATRTDILNTDTILLAFGKIKKWFADFGDLAWTDVVDWNTQIINKPVEEMIYFTHEATGTTDEYYSALTQYQPTASGVEVYKISPDTSTEVLIGKWKRTGATVITPTDVLRLRVYPVQYVSGQTYDVRLVYKCLKGAVETILSNLSFTYAPVGINAVDERSLAVSGLTETMQLGANDSRWIEMYFTPNNAAPANRVLGILVDSLAYPSVVFRNVIVGPASISDHNVIMEPRSVMTGSTLQENADVINSQMITYSSGEINTGDTLILAVNSFHIITNELTNAHTITITLAVPSTALGQIAHLEFSTGSTIPSITLTMPNAVIAVPRTKPDLTEWTASKKYSLQFVWISTTRCDIYYLIS